LAKYGIYAKPERFLSLIENYYSDLQKPLGTKEKALRTNITKSAYPFISLRSVWDFSDLSVEYDSLCWDYNEKYNFLDSLLTNYDRMKYWKKDPIPINIAVTIDMLFNKSFNQNYKSKYNTNVYEIDRGRNSSQENRYQAFINSGDEFAQKYTKMRIQDVIEYYQNLKTTLQERIDKYE